MTHRVTSLGDKRQSEVFFGRERIVCRATKSQVRSPIRTILGERSQMVQLEVASFTTSLAPRVDIRTLRAIAAIHFASLCGRDIPTALSKRYVAPTGCVAVVAVATVATVARACRRVVVIAAPARCRVPVAVATA